MIVVYFFPLSIRDVLWKKVCDALIELNYFFRLNRYERNYEGDIQQLNKPNLIFFTSWKIIACKNKKNVELYVVEQGQVRNYVLQICNEVSSFIA